MVDTVNSGKDSEPAMRIKLRNELLALNILTFLFIIVATLLPSNPWRAVLGLPFVLFFPGYTLTAAVFPKREALANLERVALSCGLSVAIVPLAGLLLNYTPWGFRLYPLLIVLTLFILVTSIIAWQRRRRLAEVERFTFSLDLSLPAWGVRTTRDRILAIVLITALAGALGTLGYVAAVPKTGQRSTEFYLRGTESYIKDVVVGEEARVVVTLANREYQTMSYRLEIWMEGIVKHERGPLVLRHDEQLNETVSFTMDRVGDNQRVEFLLYKSGAGEPYLEPLRLWIWVNVREKEAAL